MKNNNPIGVFDSGLGGLTVVKELIRQLPNENIVYFGDTARVPYGTKSKESIIRFSNENAKVLLKHKVKMIVVACNTSSSIALGALRKKFSVPILGVIEPGAEKAAAVTKVKKVGVIATPATIKSNAYAKKIKQKSSSTRVISKACPLFVPLAEEGWFKNDITFKIASMYLSDMKKKEIDALILGCTHYPLLKSTIKKVMGKRVVLIDSAEEVASKVKSMLKQGGMLSDRKQKGRHQFIVSDDPKHFSKLAKQFLGRNVKNIKRCVNV